MSEYSPYEARVPVRSIELPIRGVNYNVYEWGDADSPLLMLLHGWGDSGLSFQFLVDSLHGDWHVIAPDWRGFGRTHLRTSAYWFPDYLADLDHMLEHFSPHEGVRLVGHSMGANICGLYAGVRPTRVKAFVNIEGFGLTDTDPDDAPGRYRTWLAQGRDEQRYSRFGSIEDLARLVRRRSPGMSEAQAQFVARAWAKVGNDGLELRADPAHKLTNAVLYRRAEAEACWRRTTAPVLLVAGRDSEILTALSDHLAEGNLELPFPNRETCVIPDAGHMVHFEAPVPLAQAIEAFLRPTL